MKQTKNIKNLILISYLSMTSIGLFFVMSFSNSYMLTTSNIFGIESSNVISEETIFFSKEELQHVSETLSQSNLYYYEQLTDEEKKIFNYVYINIQKRNKDIIFEKGINPETLNKIVYILKFDCPEFFYLGNSFNYDLKGKKVINFYPEYVITISEYLDMISQINNVTKKIAEEVNDLTEYEKELYIHDYLVENITYSTTAPNCNNIFGALILGEANCEGYSSAFTYLLRTAGINATQVIGEINSNNEMIGHSWNLVKIDGDYYYVDVGWDDFKDSTEYEEVTHHYAFFNLTYDEILETRDVAPNLKYLGALPKTPAIKQNYYKKNHVYAESIEEAETIVKRDLPVAVSSNIGYCVVKCKNKEVYDKLISNITPIIQDLINEKNLAVTKCKYIKIENGYTLIIHDFQYIK